ncbi:UNKNOWN [Stylonychia lemnae]|uniref:O-acyltransferase WSD1 C-terminal domain-containing protein n=1 Tax=Stylonychia lemnae TaxID=5949 RepID=A0A078A5Z9_STYLE|nr:UNKNOWN [Stylonychia lemnae]|eukprot:CDW77670.1 UNKNOWN [Stylonychia lemnae]
MIKVQDGPDTLFYRSNIITAFHVITKTKIKDLSSIKQQIMRNTQGMPEMRSKLIKVFNNFYYKKLSDEEFEKHLDRAISQIPDEFKNEQALLDYLVTNQIKDLPRDSIQYRVMIKQDFSSDQSVVVFLFYHGLIDGVGCLNLFCALQDEFDPQNLPFVRQRSLLESVKRYAACILGIYVHLKYKPQQYRESQITQIVERNKPQITLSKDMKVDELKQKICSRFGCSINDLLLGVCLIAMRDYCLVQNVTDHTLFEFMMAINQRSPVNKKSDIRLFNCTIANQIKIDFACLFNPDLLNVSLEQQLKESLKLFKDKFQDIRTQDLGLCDITALKTLVYFLPDILIETQIEELLVHLRRAWSNLNGSPKPLMIGDAYSEKMMFCSYADQYDNMVFNSLSHNGHLRFSLSTQYLNLDSKKFIQCFDKIIEQLYQSN